MNKIPEVFCSWACADGAFPILFTFRGEEVVGLLERDSKLVEKVSNKINKLSLGDAFSEASILLSVILEGSPSASQVVEKLLADCLINQKEDEKKKDVSGYLIASIISSKLHNKRSILHYINNKCNFLFQNSFPPHLFAQMRTLDEVALLASFLLTGQGANFFNSKRTEFDYLASLGSDRSVATFYYSLSPTVNPSFNLTNKDVGNIYHVLTDYPLSHNQEVRNKCKQLVGIILSSTPLLPVLNNIIFSYLHG